MLLLFFRSGLAYCAVLVWNCAVVAAAVLGIPARPGVPVPVPLPGARQARPRGERSLERQLQQYDDAIVC